MRKYILRIFRIIFSVIVFILFFLIFVNFQFLPKELTNKVLSTQFVPSILKSLSVGKIVASSFIFIIILTILTGRTYCSFLCPLGISQDINSWLGARIRKKFKRYGYKKPHNLLRYTILVVVLGVTILSGNHLLVLLDPYSIFGRIMTFFIKPVAIVLNNFAASIMDKFNIYSLSHITIEGYPLVTYMLPLAFFVLIFSFSLAKGRLYCNTFCPVGAFLGLLSKISLFRVKIDKSKCTKCGRCAVACKSSCMDSVNNKIDITRCVNCFDCVSICSGRALHYGFVFGGSPDEKKETANNTNNVTDTEEKSTKNESIQRREFVATSVAMLLGMPSLLKAQDDVSQSALASSIEEVKSFPVCPPGAGNIDSFNSKCTACSLCINICPTGVLKPSLLEYGVFGMLQPVMNYKKGFCSYNCNACVEVCPTGALSPATIEAKQMMKLGVVQFVKDNCVVKLGKTACGACSESCPTKAVYMVPYEGNLMIPEVNPDICIGCGHCEYACPMTPYKAIFVDGLERQVVIEKKTDDKPAVNVLDDFPF